MTPTMTCVFVKLGISVKVDSNLRQQIHFLLLSIWVVDHSSEG